jgi:predicted O-linked N-acetylglucosamine transferase (SPINDLY family)
LTSGHRQAAFARRIAPVQVSYLGYPHASGIDTFDARLADAITDPPGAPNVMGERVIRLAGCFVCYRPPQDAPPIREARGPGGPVVFGCFGNLSKVNRETLRVWGRVLDAVPGSRLVLKNHALGDRFVRGEARPGTRSAIDRMREAGLDLSRVELRQPGADEAAHLDAYNDIDAALDTFPYNGTTTTCEALVMGVPVVTFGGDRHASRVGGSLLRAAGCGDWCGEGEAAFVAKAVEMADSGPRGLPARAALRDRLLASSLCDAQRHAAEFVAALSGAIGSCGAGPR